MRPLRLLLDGFGSYRQPASVDCTDVEFFALTGPTGSGKSTVIDGLCFALYGTVPRWGRENAIAHALAPAANSCRVCLVFEASGARYAAVRALARDARGQVHTREARLDRLEEALPSDAPVSDIPPAILQPPAAGPAPRPPGGSGRGGPRAGPAPGKRRRPWGPRPGPPPTPRASPSGSPGPTR